MHGKAHQVPVDRLDRTHHAILLSDRLADNFGFGNLLFIRSRLLERFRKRFLGELAHGGTDIERFNALGPERLIAKEGFDDGGLLYQLRSTRPVASVGGHLKAGS